MLQYIQLYSLKLRSMASPPAPLILFDMAWLESEVIPDSCWASLI